MPSRSEAEINFLWREANLLRIFDDYYHRKISLEERNRLQRIYRHPYRLKNTVTTDQSPPETEK